MPSVRYTYGSSFDINFNSAIAISGEIYDSDEAKYKFRAQIDPDEGGSVVSQLYNGTSNLSEDYILSSHVVSFKMDFSSNTEGVSLYGYDYDDIMNGGRGNDAFSGGAGNDTLRGMGGIDQFWADDGNDRIVVREAGASVSGGEGHDRLFLQGADSYSFSDDTLSGIEAIHVGAGANLDLSAVSAGVAIVMASKIGSPSNIVGTQGDDVITAGGGFVSIKAGDGDDVIKGGSGTANLLGEDGDDVIALGKGANTPLAETATTSSSEATTCPAFSTAMRAMTASRLAMPERRSQAARAPTNCSPVQETTPSSSRPGSVATASMASTSMPTGFSSASPVSRKAISSSGP